MSTQTYIVFHIWGNCNNSIGEIEVLHITHSREDAISYCDEKAKTLDLDDDCMDDIKRRVTNKVIRSWRKLTGFGRPYVCVVEME